MEAALRVKKLCSEFAGPFELSLGIGTCAAITGSSGSGKSLFLRMIADLDPNEGEVWLNERERASMSAPAWRKQVTYVSAESGWWTDRVIEHFAVNRRSEVAALAARLGLRVDLLDAPIAQLSTGEKQRFSLIRAVLPDPPVLLLDEPTGPLDEDRSFGSRRSFGSEWQREHPSCWALTIQTRPSAWAISAIEWLQDIWKCHAIPLAGIILGNVLNSASLSLDSFLGSVHRERQAIEARLSLGEAYRQAIAPLVREAIRRGLLPIINQMSAAGIGTLPGIMTGQILAGLDPLEAVKTQILQMFLLSGGSGLSALVVSYLAAWRLTDQRQRLRLDRLSNRS